MAASFAAAFADVEGPELDAIVYSVRRPPPAPVEKKIGVAFEGFDYDGCIGGTARRIRRRVGSSLADAEDATHGAFAELLEKHRQWLLEGPEAWMGWLYKTAYYRLIEMNTRPERVESIEALSERAGDAALGGARRCLPIPLGAEEESRSEPTPRPGEEWTRTRIIGALQRFGDRHHRPPRISECRLTQMLPSPTTIHRHFGSFAKALIAAGMVPDTLGHRRRPWKAVESAELCRSFRRRNWRWPDWIDVKRNTGELPSRTAMIRFFGSTRPGEVQQHAEAILASEEAAPA
jgi:HNH endonuclease